MKNLILVFIMISISVACQKNVDDKGTSVTLSPKSGQQNQPDINFDVSNLIFTARNPISGQFEAVQPSFLEAFLDENYSDPVGNLFIVIKEFPKATKSEDSNRGFIFLTLKRDLGVTQNLIQYPERFTNPPSAIDYLGDPATGQIIVHELNGSYVDIEFKKVSTLNAVISGRVKIPMRK